MEGSKQNHMAVKGSLCSSAKSFSVCNDENNNSNGWDGPLPRPPVYLVDYFAVHIEPAKHLRIAALFNRGENIGIPGIVRDFKAGDNSSLCDSFKEYTLPTAHAAIRSTPWANLPRSQSA
jgi:hypothetical protein